MTLPTVRVANPAVAGGYMTINQVDLAEHHTLWPEQAEGFVPLPPKAAIMDPAVRDLAANITIERVAHQLKAASRDWFALAPAEQLGLLRDTKRVNGEHLMPSAVNQALAVIKGPRGLWYVTRGDERVSKGYPTQPEASAELTRITAA